MAEDPVTKEIRELIFKMVVENPTWRAPRIHGELLMLGYDVSERSVSRWMQRAPHTPESGQRWRTFLRNHHETIAAMDFFSVPTLTFNVLHVFFLIGHDRRRILHFNVTRHPWVANCRRELLDHVIAINSSHLKRLIDSYIDYCHEDSSHCGLQKQTPAKRRCAGQGQVVSLPRVGGLPIVTSALGHQEQE